MFLLLKYIIHRLLVIYSREPGKSLKRFKNIFDRLVAELEGSFGRKLRLMFCAGYASMKSGNGYILWESRVGPDPRPWDLASDPVLGDCPRNKRDIFIRVANGKGPRWLWNTVWIIPSSIFETIKCHFIIALSKW